jgi:hypothetical protein
VEMTPSRSGPAWIAVVAAAARLATALRKRIEGGDDVPDGEPLAETVEIQADEGLLTMLGDKEARDAFFGDLEEAAMLVLERVLAPSPFAQAAIGSLSLGLAAHHNGTTLRIQLAAWLDPTQTVWN